VRAGLPLLPHEPRDRLAALARRCEASGCDHLWLADERCFREAYASLTVAAAATSRVTLGPCVTDPCSRHTIRRFGEEVLPRAQKALGTR
jgi:alkanesulfonate monooxygenase SsuD/methylene tetrahydromethanopterin reductase-like flavin-dependent oxidoreductase (luciferase family)